MHIVLVHGMGASAFTWSLVAPILEARGHTVSVADNASQSLEDDVAAVRSLVDAVDDDALLVGHSYGGAVITNAGRHERVRGLVYIAAFAPTEGESVNSIVSSNEPAPVSQYFSRGPNGEWIADESDEAWQALAWDVPEHVRLAEREHRRDSADAIFTTVTGTPAWSLRPAWYLLATSDRHILPRVQRMMAERAGARIREVDTSHAIAHAAPESVVALIEEALGDLAAA
ncbi:alpha/beta hydrolase [Salinibacterium sp. SYSU T00001]|uniref:alpha/beta fold hydrolase n=1 Tax=Homoserinimonas sedimenticola TaxID=2986805 RepID=UPI002236A4A7|nr:alpha/beta hydrolase [Salinibacterium sedimenticola]MCW4385938.1 alpha/beta hydrolase [Salinibacterium sedimenticola]